MIMNYFVCTIGDEKKIFMITLDKGLAEMCLRENKCDDIKSIGTVRGYDEIANMVCREDCETVMDLEYMIMYG